MFDDRFTILRYGDFHPRDMEDNGALVRFAVNDSKDGAEFALTDGEATHLDNLIRQYMAGGIPGEAVASWLVNAINNLTLGATKQQ